MLTALRRELRARLDALPVARPAVLRRAREEAWLFASDAPALLEGEALRALLQSLQADGWTASVGTDGWLRLDHRIALPKSLSPVPGVDTAELDCLLSLLARHPSDLEDADTLRSLCKAWEEGAITFNRCIRQLHGSWAVCLREHKPLPGGLTPYLQLMRASAIP